MPAGHGQGQREHLSVRVLRGGAVGGFYQPPVARVRAEGDDRVGRVRIGVGRMRGQQIATPGIVGVEHQRPAGVDARDEALKGAQHDRVVGEQIRVVELDVGDDRHLGPQPEERVVVFVRLHHEVRPAAIAGVLAQFAHRRADGERRIGSCSLQRQRRHA